MKKTTRILGILLIAAMLLGALAMTASAATGTVSYIDADGTEKTQVSVEQWAPTTTNSITLTSGWHTFTQSVTTYELVIEGDVHLILMDGVTLTVQSGVKVYEGNSITIYGQKNQTGTLLANTNKSAKASGIGGVGRVAGSDVKNGGTITINGGIITANGGSEGVGIGGALNADCGDITINGGTVTAISNGAGPGIGSGISGAQSNCDIVINGGTVVAQGGSQGAGIGSGHNGSYNSITINGGNVTATGKSSSAGIGTGTATKNEFIGKITINGGVINATGGGEGAGIGGGRSDDAGEIEINGGYIVATTTNGAGIGGGSSGSATKIAINGGTIIATGGNRGVGIGGGAANTSGGYNPSTVIINGGSIFASGPYGAIGNGATVQDADGNALSLVTYTINGVFDGTAVTDIVGIDYNEKDIVVNSGEIALYLPSDSVVTRIYVGDGTQFCLPDSEGSTAFTLHDVHTVAPGYTAHATDTEQHVATYSCCGTVVEEAHSFSATGRCICGAQAVASLTNGEDVTYYLSLQDAVTAAQSANGSTVTMLDHVLLPSRTAIEIHGGTFTIDLKGQTLRGDDYIALWIRGETAVITLMDSATGGSIESGSTSAAAVQNWGTLTIESGTVKGAYKAINNDGSLTVTGGTVEGTRYALYMGSSTTTQINDGTFVGNVYGSADYTITGGTFTGGQIGINKAGCKVSITGGTFDITQFGVDNGEISVTGGSFNIDPAAHVPTGYAVTNADGYYTVALCTHETYTYTASGGTITATCAANCGYNGTATVTAEGKTYDGTPVTATVTAAGALENETFTLTYCCEGGCKSVGDHTVNITLGEKTATATFSISKGILKVVTVPTATHEFGDTHSDKAITGGKVVIEGNETVEITGTWAWVEGTTTATFTPDAEFVDLFEALEAQNVAITVTPTTPIITITSPSPSIMPGMSIVFDMVVENPHTANPEKLPIHYRYVYKIGENGALQTTSWSATKLTIPSDVTVGETIYVYVESDEYEDKYAIGTSNTIALLVGQVDYTQDINDLQAAIDQVAADLATAQQALQDAIDVNADNIADLVTDLTAKYNELVALIGQLPEGVESMKEYVDSALAAAQTTLQAAIDQVQANLEKAQKDLQAAIDTNADNIADLVADLTAKYNELIALIGELPEGVESMKEYVDSTLAAAQTTLQAAIDQVADDLEKAQKDLQDAIDTNADSIADLVTDLTTKYNELIALIGQLPEGVESMKEYVDSALAAAQTTLQAAIDQVAADLATAQQALQDAIDTNADNITALVADLTAKYNELIALIGQLPEGVESMKEYVDSALAAAQTTLQAAIDQVQANLEKAQEDLQAAIDANETDIEAKVTALSEAIEATKAAAEAGDAALRSELASAQASLNASINAVARDLAAAKSSLMNAINSGDAALTMKIEKVDAALTAAIAANAAADEATKAELTALIQEADAVLQAAIDQVAADLAAAQQALNEAIASGDKALDDKIAALNTALENAVAASSAADEALSAEMARAVAALEKAIAQVQKNLDEAKAELAAQDEAMQAELEKLNTFVIVVCVIAGTALCGCGVLVYFAFFGKRKLI